MVLIPDMSGFHDSNSPFVLDSDREFLAKANDVFHSLGDTAFGKSLLEGVDSVKGAFTSVNRFLADKLGTNGARAGRILDNLDLNLSPFSADKAEKVGSISSGSVGTGETDDLEGSEGSSKDDILASINNFLNRIVSTNDAANAMAVQNARNAQDYEHREAEIARQWFEQMENTYVQRRMEDVEKAGLNRWMALYGNLGNTGASSSSSASGHMASTFKSKGTIEEYLLPIIFETVATVLGSITSASNAVGSFFNGI